MVAHTKKHHDVLHSGAIGALHPQNRDVLMVHRLRVLTGSGISQHAASVQTPPPDNGWTVLVVGAVEHVELNAGFLCDLRHGFRMAEDVRLPRHADVMAKFFLAVFLAVEELPHQRFAVNDVLIHLHPTRGNRDEVAGARLLLKGLENIRVKVLHRVEDHGLVLRKRVFRILVHQPDLVGKSVVHDVVDGLFPAPQPRHVHVGVTHHVGGVVFGLGRRWLRRLRLDCANKTGCYESDHEKLKHRYAS